MEKPVDVANRGLEASLSTQVMRNAYPLLCSSHHLLVASANFEDVHYLETLVLVATCDTLVNANAHFPILVAARTITTHVG
jgi:hypothetical protein